MHYDFELDNGSSILIEQLYCHMITENFQSKEMRRWILKIRMPSGHCQACLSDKSPDKDFMLTCTVCQSSIHNKHYGREIDEGNTTIQYDRWKCERCRLASQLALQNNMEAIQKIQCHFCPGSRGIMKRAIYNNSQTVWLHPECSTWPYPIIFHKNSRRIHYNCEYPSRPTSCFWVNLQKQASTPCGICHSSKGYKIKCMYYTCDKFYHCSCSKTIGFIRDLESMHIQAFNTYIALYCQEHLQKRVQDCEIKAKKYSLLGEEVKASHFFQLIPIYQGQLKNMKMSAQKHIQQEQIRMHLEYQTGEKQDLIEQISFQNCNESFRSSHSSDFIQNIFDRDYPTTPRKTSPKIQSIIHKKCKISQMELEPPCIENQHQQMDQQVQPIQIPTFFQGLERQPRDYARESEPQQSQWGANSQQFQSEY